MNLASKKGDRFSSVPRNCSFFAHGMITADDVKKIAGLACISVKPDEVESVTAKLNSILGYVEQLKSIDVSSAEPMSHVHGSTNVFRPDVVLPDKNPQSMLNNAPSRSGNFLKVPIIIEQ